MEKHFYLPLISCQNLLVQNKTKQKKNKTNQTTTKNQQNNQPTNQPKKFWELLDHQEAEQVWEAP